MKDDKKTNMKGNESGKKMVTSTEKQLKNEEEEVNWNLTYPTDCVKLLLNYVQMKSFNRLCST